eukprot:Hpha_TRINITY_DN20329_c0_g1::TRINITY_DN20329_c0_g1_i1::g.138202::m.138202
MFGGSPKPRKSVRAEPVKLSLSKKFLDKADLFKREDVLLTVKAGRPWATSSWVGFMLSVSVLVIAIFCGVRFYYDFKSKPPFSHSEPLWSAEAFDINLPLRCESESGCVVALVATNQHSASMSCRQKQLKGNKFVDAGCQVLQKGETAYLPLCYAGTAEDGVVVMWPEGEEWPSILSEVANHNGTSHVHADTLSDGVFHVSYVLTENHTQPEFIDNQWAPSGRKREEFFVQYIRPMRMPPGDACSWSLPGSGMPPPPGGGRWPGMLCAMYQLTPMYTQITVTPRGSFVLHLFARVGGVIGWLMGAAALLAAAFIAVSKRVPALQALVPQVPED